MYFRKYAKKSNKEKIIFLIAAAAAALLITVPSGSDPFACKADALDSGIYRVQGREQIAFYNSVPTVTCGHPCINILGYFVTATDSSGNPYGTVFTSCGSSTGRAGYSLYTSDGSKINGNTEQSIDFSRRNGAIRREMAKYGIASHIDNLFTGREVGAIRIEELICTARATGAGVARDSNSSFVNTTLGAGDPSTGTLYPINTQVAFYTSNPSTADVISDLNTINGASSISQMRTVPLKVFAINPHNVVAAKCYSSSAGISVCHYGSGIADSCDLFGGGYNQRYGFMPNLNVKSFVTSWFSDAGYIANECYTPLLTVNFDGTDQPLNPGEIPTTSGGNLSTIISGRSDYFNRETNVLYSGELGHFYYGYYNNSYRITQQLDWNNPATGMDEEYTADFEPEFAKHWTSITTKSSHQELSTSDFTNAYEPAATAVGKLWAASLVGNSSVYNEYHRQLTPGLGDTLSFATSPSFRVNYNTYNQFPGKLVPGRATMWNATGDTPAYASNSMNIKIIPSDLQAYDIKLKDAKTGVLVDTPYVGEYVIPIYYYYNNTDSIVMAIGHGDTTGSPYLAGYKDDFMTPFYIDAHSYVTKEGSAFRILKTNNQSVRSFSVSCSVWMQDFDHDASWESNSSNNELTKTFNVRQPLYGSFIEPNADYREDTDVVSGFRIYNDTGYDIQDSSGLNSVLTVQYNVNGTPQTQTVHVSETGLSPQQNNTIIWFKWHVPHGAEGTVKLSVQIDPTKNFIDLSPWGDPRISGQWNISRQLVCETPDTAYADSVPSWYDIYTNKLDLSKSRMTNNIQARMGWKAWRQNASGELYQEDYWVEIPSTFTSYIEPHNSPTAAWKNNKWYMKAGYGFTLTTSSNAVNKSNAVTNADCTEIQNCYTLFPEFMYDAKVGSGEASDYFNARYGFKQPATASWVDSVANATYGISNGTYGTVTSLQKTGFGGFTFPVNSAMLDYVHYTPDWMFDGSYRVENYAYDVWTPVGMCSYYSHSNEIRIRGSMYSDYYVAGD